MFEYSNESPLGRAFLGFMLNKHRFDPKKDALTDYDPKQMYESYEAGYKQALSDFLNITFGSTEVDKRIEQARKG